MDPLDYDPAKDGYAAFDFATLGIESRDEHLRHIWLSAHFNHMRVHRQILEASRTLEWVSVNARAGLLPVSLPFWADHTVRVVGIDTLWEHMQKCLEEYARRVRTP